MRLSERWIFTAEECGLGYQGIDSRMDGQIATHIPSSADRWNDERSSLPLSCSLDYHWVGFGLGRTVEGGWWWWMIPDFPTRPDLMGQGNSADGLASLEVVLLVVDVVMPHK